MTGTVSRSAAAFSVRRNGHLALLPLLAASTVLGQPEPAAREKPASRPLQQPGPPTTDSAQPAAEGEVAVTVNGTPILEAAVNEALLGYLQQQTQGGALSPEDLARAREAQRPQILERMIVDALLDREADKQQITLTDDEALAEMQAHLAAYLVRTESTREVLEEQIRRQTGSSLEDFIETQAAEPMFRRVVRHTKLLEKRFPEQARVSDEAVKQRYEQMREEAFTKPAEVRASHILVRTEDMRTSEQRRAALARAEEILEEAKKPGTDFAELARQRSEGPSAPKGGDVGFFQRKGVMVEPFAAAAFTLKPGAISDIVETDFGFHIIKVTDRKEAVVVGLEQAGEQIRSELKNEQLAAVRDQYIDELKKAAKIEYPD